MHVITLDRQALVAKIREQTARLNRNNVTRTQAYLHFYQEHEEIHWALLAHLVSRNGGWNMTDLRGEWLPYLMDESSIQSYFWFLERCNWLIFHDAYAQLMLYAEMKRTKSDLTSLLAPLGVSAFMRGFWKDFLTTRDSAKLTKALIVNEQQYIEQRVVKKPITVHRIFSTLTFFAQSWLSLNQILFPYKEHPTDKRLQLVGMTCRDFPSLTARIAIGKALYELLYNNIVRLNSIRQFAYRIPHTGSRADYWPHLFTPAKPPCVAREHVYRLRLNGDERKEGASKLYSPSLANAWSDTAHTAADGTDWYRDDGWLKVVDEPVDLPTIDTSTYTQTLRWIEYGVKAVSLFD